MWDVVAIFLVRVSLRLSPPHSQSIQYFSAVVVSWAEGSSKDLCISCASTHQNILHELLGVLARNTACVPLVRGMENGEHICCVVESAMQWQWHWQFSIR